MNNSFKQFLNSNPLTIPYLNITLNFKSKSQIKNYLYETQVLEPSPNSKFFDFVPAPYNYRPIIKPQFFKSLTIISNNNKYIINNYQEYLENYLSFCEFISSSNTTYLINNNNYLL